MLRLMVGTDDGSGPPLSFPSLPAVLYKSMTASQLERKNMKVVIVCPPFAACTLCAHFCSSALPRISWELLRLELIVFGSLPLNSETSPWFAIVFCVGLLVVQEPEQVLPAFTYFYLLLSFKALDYEDERQRRDGFWLDVRVFDGIYEAQTRVHIRVEDRNDNAPVFDPPPKGHGSPGRYKVEQLREDVKRGHLIAKLHASDADANDRIE
ncbi:cadherin-related hmr-1 [Ditylenchus destructor]|uniref:Cadherin-related hmr-1 n=1 Tax=Ditylenchus destructor TaxID=166010 RepID=A0AAD4NDD4_9BILA|nr:cadherin-related hmr-1 [Ditylenchus destructor]